MFFGKFLTLMILGLVPFSTFAGVKVTGLDLNIQGANGFLNISTEGRSGELPDVKVSGKTIEITLSRADSFKTITKNMSGAHLSASLVDGKAIIKANLPYAVAEDSINLGWKNNKIEVIFPRGKVIRPGPTVAAAELGVSPKETLPPKKEKMPSVSRESLNENYLNKLMNENTPKKAEAPKQVKKDVVSVKQASTTKTNAIVAEMPKGTDNFSFAGYAAKFTVFLALVLGIFYGVVQLLKKGVFSRGKLGFLNSTQMIEILSTTYVSPKRTLMVVRAHKQIFLVANSESGFTFLSEMKDTSGLLKEGERMISGTNFDVNLNEAAMNEFMGIKVKEDIMESAPLPPETGLEKLASAKDDIVKFSDELKKKAKKLRPIENRV